MDKIVTEYDPDERPKREERDWRCLFSEETLKEGEKLQNKITEFESYSNGSACGASLETGETGPRSRGRSRVYYKPSCSVRISRTPVRFSDSWERASFYCSCQTSYVNARCAHAAAVMIRWEKEHGPWIVVESEAERSARLREKKREIEKERRKKLKEKLDVSPFPATQFFLPRPESDKLLFFDLEAALKGFETNAYYVHRAKELLSGDELSDLEVRIRKDRYGNQILSASIRCDCEIEKGFADCSVTGDRIITMRSRINMSDHYTYWFEDGNDTVDLVLNEYELALISRLWDHLENQEQEEQTDDKALAFFRNLEMSEKLLREQTIKPKEKQKKLVLSPRITVEDGLARLSFKMGKAGQKQLILRNLPELVRAFEQEETLALSRTETVDFSALDFEESSEGWLQFIQRRVREITDVNEKLSRRNFGYGGTSIAVNFQQELKGSLLDHFYEIGEGSVCEYQDKTNNVKNVEIPIGHQDMKLCLCLDRLSDARKRFAGVTVSGYLPVLISGASSQYILNRECLSRITEEEERVLLPFHDVADASGYFRFQVGLSHLNEFYYRVLPRLLQNPKVEVEDRCGEEAAAYLPPEAVFTFYLDYENEILSGRVTVAYDEKEYILSPRKTAGEDYRDLDQEERVERELERWFQSYDPKKQVYWTKIGEEELFRFLMEGVSGLDRFGQVKGTDAFRNTRVRQIPKIQVGVSVQSGIMDLCVTSKEMGEKELLELLKSYTLKKRFHRLKSGEFIDLSDDEEFRSTLDFLTGLDLVPQEVIRKKAHLPLYRALYLDRMLEEHDRVIAQRDRTYRALIKNFRTVADSDYEAPESLGEILRPYQAYGYKWLKTLKAAGFGGILADEMGLGKTLQTIAFFLSAKEEGEEKPALVICPASLVYNWKEELHRFAPGLSVTVLGGNASERKKLLKKIEEDEKDQISDVYITSYDLLKRDIVLYESLAFSTCVLDEAQFIKNQKAAAAKSVKAINAEQRFALTGTPIENRLSELWSIFDFLMPGFLYDSPEFIKRFEAPIAREKDEKATLKLKQMTGPFILRRRKEDVLKDLPQKLEEVRYTEFEGEQQKLYDSQVVHMKQLLQLGSGSGEDKIRIFAELTRIRQICCDPSLIFEGFKGSSAKREACMQLVKTAID